MSIVAKIFEWIGQFAVNIISSMGYFGVFFLMILESMVIPIPSELIMPFAGFLVATGEFSFFWVIVFSSLGSIVGSLLSYYMGYYGGKPLLTRYGKYFLVNNEDLKKTENWFNKRGEITIFIGRLVPVVRHLISIPAGISKMKLGKFCLYTLLGATIWNTFLAYLGYVLGQHWNYVRQYTEPLSMIMAVVIVIGVIWFIWHHFFGNRKLNKKVDAKKNVVVSKRKVFKKK
jgi:membrane protein DedA with SNARE-associated domain